MTSLTTVRPISDDVTMLQGLIELRGRRVLDVGCGRGTLVLWLAGQGADAVGMEISDDQLAAAREADVHHAATWIVGSGEAVPLPDASLDAVLFMRSLHHVPPDLMGAALAEARRLLRDGGCVYVAEPLAEGTFFELVRIVDDETEVRGAVQELLKDPAPHGLVTASVTEYDTRVGFDAFAGLRALMISVDPARGAVFDRAEPQLREAYDRLVETDPQTGRATFVQPMRVHVLRPAEAG
jgi:ubiquinone/menaquinone biosynthesis C-methylase UbiE